MERKASEDDDWNRECLVEKRKSWVDNELEREGELGEDWRSM